MRRARMTEQELESTVAVVQRLCVTVHSIRSSYSGAFAHTIWSVETNVKPVKESEQGAWL